MKRALLAACLGLAVSACAEGYYGSGGYGGYGGYGGGLAYYDDFYGPYYNGYWGGDGFYYYSLGRDRPFQRDEGHHFRRDGGGAGFHGVRGHQGGRRGQPGGQPGGQPDGRPGGQPGDHDRGDRDRGGHDRPDRP